MLQIGTLPKGSQWQTKDNTKGMILWKKSTQTQKQTELKQSSMLNGGLSALFRDSTMLNSETTPLIGKWMQRFQGKRMN